jgi:spore germination cell wall hydrolase CwlJ-like protein
MPTLPSKRLMATLPLMLAAASCVPAQASQSPKAEIIAAASESPTPGFSFEELAPVSSLGRLAPAQEAHWRKAADMLSAPSATPAAPFALQGAEDDRQRALACLTAAVYYEARSEGSEGQRAVAQVVLNRVRHPAFPDSVCGVVYQGSGRRTGCQFSFTCDGSLHRRREPAAWARARRIAADALEGEVYAPVGNATHYHTSAVLPYWAGSLSRAATVGAHIFYRWRGGAGGAGAFRQRYAGYEGAPFPTPSARPVVLRPTAEGRIERVKAEGRTVIVHRGAPDAAAQPVAEQFGVRVHVGAALTSES